MNIHVLVEYTWIYGQAVYGQDKLTPFNRLTV